MSEGDHGLHHAVAPGVTRDAFDEKLTFGEAGSSSAAKRWHSAVRSREGGRSSGTSVRHALHANLTRAKASKSTWANNYGTTLPPVTINGGTLDVIGSISNSSSVTVNSGGTLTGTGTVGS